MKLVEATVDELDALVTRWYGLATAMEKYSDLNELVYADIDAVPDDGFRARLEDDSVTDYLLVENGETIGFLTLQEGHHPSRQYSQYLRILNLAIDEKHRNQGYGTEVIERVKALASERGCDHLKVSCEWHNDGARRFYRETGFQPKQVDYAQPIK